MKKPDMLRKTYDYLVIGGGSAGCVLATRLSESPDVSVLLVEAGGRDRHPLFHIPAGFAKMTKGMASWGWSTVPQRALKGRSLWYTQARVIGGGSSINAQIYTRGNRRDYDCWAQDHGCAGWGYADVLPYFKRAEGNARLCDNFHGQDGPLGISDPCGTLPICDAFLQAAQEWGLPHTLDFNGISQAGCGFYQLTQKDARRSSTARAFLKPSEARPNLTVVTGTHVLRILVESGAAAGIELVRGSDVSRVDASVEVVLSAGAIGSPHLLLRSGIGPADHLRSFGIDVKQDAPGVGENLQDHLDLSTISECTGPHSYDGTDRLDRTLRAGLQYLLTRKGPASASLFETGGFWAAESDPDWPDIQFHLGQGSGIEKGIAKVDGWGMTLNSAFLRPQSRGTVRLQSSDPSVAPLIDPRYWSEPHDRDMSLLGLQAAREIMRQPALAPYIRKEVLPGAKANAQEVLDHAITSAKTDHHPVGTCRMGGDQSSVVAPDLKMRGVARLRVCDASVMPQITSCNTNAPTIMIAEKAADLIRGLNPLPTTQIPACARVES
ncbi:MAG: GMC family oxidoreductase [Roseobacter sp.]